MNKREKIAVTPKKTIRKDKIVQSLISSFRIEDIHISENIASEIFKKVNLRIKKQAL